jgi:hypothetical protein
MPAPEFWMPANGPKSGDFGYGNPPGGDINFEADPLRMAGSTPYFE